MWGVGPGHTHGAITVILWGVTLGISAEEIAVLAVGKTPAQFVPRIFEVGLAGDGLPFGKISHRIIAADRELGFFAPRSRHENGCEEQPDHHRGRRQPRYVTLPHGLLPWIMTRLLVVVTKPSILRAARGGVKFINDVH